MLPDCFQKDWNNSCFPLATRESIHFFHPSQQSELLTILLTSCLSNVYNTASYCYWNLHFPSIINLSTFSHAVGQLDLLLHKMNPHYFLTYFSIGISNHYIFSFFIDTNPLIALCDETLSSPPVCLLDLIISLGMQIFLNFIWDKTFIIFLFLKLFFFLTFCVSSLG